MKNVKKFDQYYLKEDVQYVQDEKSEEQLLKDENISVNEFHKILNLSREFAHKLQNKSGEGLLGSLQIYLTAKKFWRDTDSIFEKIK